MLMPEVEGFACWNLSGATLAAALAVFSVSIGIYLSRHGDPLLRGHGQTSVSKHCFRLSIAYVLTAACCVTWVFAAESSRPYLAVWEVATVSLLCGAILRYRVEMSRRFGSLVHGYSLSAVQHSRFRGILAVNIVLVATVLVAVVWGGAMGLAPSESLGSWPYLFQAVLLIYTIYKLGQIPAGGPLRRC